MNTTDSITENANQPQGQRLQTAVGKWLEANAGVLQEWRRRAGGRQSPRESRDPGPRDSGCDGPAS